MIPVCGEINTWHWRHVTKVECNSKPETEWHRKLKNSAEHFNCEVEIRIGNGEHIADVVASHPKKRNGYKIKGNIIELQHSSITSEEVIDRCVFYLSNGYKTTWLFDLSEKYKAGHIELKKLNANGAYIFNQKWQKRVLNSLVSDMGFPAFGRVYLDFGDIGYFRVKKVYDTGNGWGIFTKEKSIFGAVK